MLQLACNGLNSICMGLGVRFALYIDTGHIAWTWAWLGIVTVCEILQTPTPGRVAVMLSATRASA